VLDHPEPARLRIAARSGRLLAALEPRALLDVGARAVEPRLFVVPEREADRALGRHVRHAEDARELHHERRAGAVVVRRLAPAVAVHVRADDVHLLRPRGPDLRAEDLFARPVRRGLLVELTDPRIGLRGRVLVHAGLPLDAAKARAS